MSFPAPSDDSVVEPPPAVPTAASVPLTEATRAAVLQQHETPATSTTSNHNHNHNHKSETSTTTLNATTFTTTTTPRTVQHCLVCYSELSYVTITPCGHNEICGQCHLRLRHLHHDTKCPICKTQLEQIIVDHQHTAKATFDEYPIWGNDLGSQFVYKDQMFVRSEYFETELAPLFAIRCHVCSFDAQQLGAEDDNYFHKHNNNNNNNNKKPPPPPTQKTSHTPPLRKLQDHLRNRHRLQLCQLCTDNQRDFVSQLPRYTPSQLQQHLNQGDPSQGFTGHPQCAFCKPKRFYDSTALYQHLNKDHYKCHVCQQAHNLDHQFFKDYSQLSKHFERHHFLCPDPQCLMARFVVFANELDFQHHQRTVHGGLLLRNNGTSTKIQLEFRIRGSPSTTTTTEDRSPPTESDFQYGLDGRAFVPPNFAPPQSFTNESPTDQGNSTTTTTLSLHPLHVQRTAQLRQQAVALRDRDQVAPNNHFPQLNAPSESSSQAPLRTGWTSYSSLGNNTALQRVVGKPKPAGAVTDQDFPTLPTTTTTTNHPKKNHNLHSHSTNHRTGLQRQMATMTTPSSSNHHHHHHHHTGGASWTATKKMPSNSTNNSSSSSLTNDNFPSLGGGSHARYSAAEAYARRSNNLPTPSSSSSSSGPNLSSVADFPSMTSGAAPNQPRKPPPPPATQNVLQFPSLAAHPKGTSLDDLKTILGSAQYKQLKSWTKELAQGHNNSFVDQVATLFPQQYADPDFWNYIPALLQSCPPTTAQQQATQYLYELQRSRNGAINHEQNQQRHWQATNTPIGATVVWGQTPSNPKKTSSSSNTTPPAWSTVSGTNANGTTSQKKTLKKKKGAQQE